jgi:hypothetical protein
MNTSYNYTASSAGGMHLTSSLVPSPTLSSSHLGCPPCVLTPLCSPPRTLPCILALPLTPSLPLTLALMVLVAAGHGGG